jgi:hypothetical protein
MMTISDAIQSLLLDATGDFAQLQGRIALARREFEDICAMYRSVSRTPEFAEQQCRLAERSFVATVEFLQREFEAAACKSSSGRFAARSMPRSTGRPPLRLVR